MEKEHINSMLDSMIDALTKKTEILDSIIIANGKQKNILAEAELDFDKFDDSLEEKTLLIEQLNHLDEAFTSVYDRVKEEIVNNKSKYRDYITRMQSLITEITDKSVKIQSEEARNRTLAEKALNASRKGVGAARRSNTMANNYYKSMSQVTDSPQFFDKQK